MKTPAAGRFPGRIAVLLLLLFLLTFSGCSAEKAKAGALRLFGILSEEDYLSYVSLVDEGQLNPDNSYAAPELEETPEPIPPEGSIHVTFAQNAYLDIQYYLDAALAEAVDTTWCYLMPGDCVYASEPVCAHPFSQWYKFDRFRVNAYDGNGNKTQELSWGDDENAALVFHIPEDYTGTEISVIPIGRYENHTLELSDYFTDSTGHRQELSGTWIVNDTEVSAERIEISPVESLSVDFVYDAEKFDFVSSSPSSFYHEKGLVRFEDADASIMEQYSVELRPLEGMFLFDPSQYSAVNGTVTFEYTGRVVTEACYIPDGSSIIYTAVPDEGYISSTGSGQISVNASDPDGTYHAIIKAITFYPDEEITVSLPQPAIGGTIEYTANGKVLSGSTCTVPCGTVITMKFNRWNGWIVDQYASTEYTVEPGGNQSVNISGSDFDKLFTESDDHKPTLNIILTDSMKAAGFAVAASDGSKNDLSYDKGTKTSIIPDLLGQNDREIFGGDKIGTGSGITLTVTDDTIFNGYAMKLEIIKRDTKKNEFQSIVYITDLPVKETIDIYEKDQMADTTVVCESVTIKISKVEVSTYSTVELDHAAVAVRLADEETPRTLQNGDVLESSRNVEITITPDKGYYIKESNQDNGVYSETMKYSKWEKESKKFLGQHVVQKIWYVTLDTFDSYGTCVYKLDSRTISSTTTVGIKEGQKLTLEYTLTDPNYRIVRSFPDNLFGDIFHSNTESISITVSDALDGQTVRRSDHITIEQKEG